MTYNMLLVSVEISLACLFIFQTLDGMCAYIYVVVLCSRAELQEYGPIQMDESPQYSL
jgi:hypothetical protein